MRMTTYQMGIVVLRIGVAFAFLYPPLSALFEPYAWLGYFPAFARGIVPDMVLLHGFGLLEVLIALWILSGKRIFVPSLIAAALLVAIVIFDHNSFSVLFRDVSIAAGALSLALFARSPGGRQKDEARTS